MNFLMFGFFLAIFVYNVWCYHRLLYKERYEGFGPFTYIMVMMVCAACMSWMVQNN